jgi:hypothetical protein
VPHELSHDGDANVRMGLLVAVQAARKVEMQRRRVRRRDRRGEDGVMGEAKVQKCNERGPAPSVDCAKERQSKERETCRWTPLSPKG